MHASIDHHFHAEVILFPASTAHFYFLFLISMFLPFEVASYRWVKQAGRLQEVELRSEPKGQ
jgi:hypothetical protein